MLQRLLSTVLVVTFLCWGTGCARTSGLLKPGDSIGDMTLVKATPDAVRYSDLCPNSGEVPDPVPPRTIHADCQVPSNAMIWLNDGWLAKYQQLLDENWRVMNFEMYIDDRKVDLEAFGTTDEMVMGLHGRMFNVALKNPSGKHIIRSVIQVEEDIHDGVAITQNGTHETVTTLTITGE